MIIQTDRVASYIRDSLARHNLSDKANVIYLSDHGMDSLVQADFIDITKMLTNGTYDLYGNSPVLQVVPRPGQLATVLQQLEQGAAANGHFKVYTMETLPARWKCSNDQRMGPIAVVADIKYGFQDMFGWLPMYAAKFNITCEFWLFFLMGGWLLSTYMYFYSREIISCEQI